jgi:PAS domain S-box-containing protein
MTHESPGHAPPATARFATVGLVVAVAGIVAATFSAYRAQMDDLHDRVDTELLDVASLQVERLEAWHEERAAEATYIASLPSVSAAVARLAAGDAGAVREVEEAIVPLLRNHEYRGACILDPSGRELLRVGAQDRPRPQAEGDLEAARATGQPVLVDRHASGAAGPFLLNLLAAVPPAAGTAASPGFVTLRLEPAEFHRRVLRGAPSRNRTSRTLLVRRDEGELVYLAAAAGPGAPIEVVRRPAGDPGLFGGRTIEDAEEGLDPRGVPSFAVVLPVRGTHWSVIAAIDRGERVGDARARTLRTIGSGALAMGLVASLYALWLRARRARLVAERLRAERYLSRANRLLGGVGEVVARTRDRQALFEQTCRVAVECGELCFAAIALVHDGGRVRVVSSYGAAKPLLDGLLAAESRRADDGREAAAAIGGARSVIDDVAADARVARWRDVLLDAGVRSCATFPLVAGGATIGALRLCAKEPGFFGEDELATLARVTESLSFALDALDRDERRASAERALEQSEAALRGFFGESQVLMCLVEIGEDATYRFALANPPLARLVGVDPSAFAGTKGKTALELGLSERTIDELRPRLLGLRPGEATTWEQAVEIGERRRVLVISATAIRGDAPGRRIGLLGVDITALRAAEQALRHEDERRRVLARLIEQSSNLVLVTDTAGRIEYVNPRFTEVTGYALADVAGQSPRVLQSGRTPAATHEALWKAILSGETWRGELVNRTRDGKELVVAATLSPIVDERGDVSHFVGTQEDVTERRRLEAEVLQSQKLESLGMLAGGVAHDFNNLLTAILGYAGFLAEELPDGSEAQADALEIHRTGERAAALTRQLLAFSRRQAISPVVVNLSELVVNLHKMLRRLIGENIELAVVPSAADPFVMADPGQIEQVVLNLAVNARDAMPERGILRIETGFAEVRLHDGPMAPPPGRYAVLRVADSGTGMSDATMARIFEPFFTTKEKGRGTGLGLSTCFGIVKQSGGHIRVRSKLGEGSVFEVLLPPIVAPAGALAAPEHAEARVASRTTVLLAEDEPAVRTMAARALSDAGFEVVAATDGEEALGLLRQRPDAFGLLVTDVVMPRMAGVELVAAARDLCPRLPVLLVSGYVDGPALETLQRGGESFLSKPFTASSLVRRAHEALAT